MAVTQQIQFLDSMIRNLSKH